MSDYIYLVLVNGGKIFKGPHSMGPGDMIEGESGSLFTVCQSLFAAVDGEFYNFCLARQGLDDFPTYKAYYCRHEAQHE